MNRVQSNQLKRVRRIANEFLSKRMELASIPKEPTSSICSPSVPSVQSFSSLCNEVSNIIHENSEDPSLNENNLTSSQEEDNDFVKEIASWVVNSRTPAMHVDSLLRIVKRKEPKLPITCKTLLQTPKNAYEDVIPMCNGYYLHIGLQKMLTMFLSMHKLNDKKIIVDVGIDGTPSTNSTDTELWPIMVNVVGFEEVLLVGSYFGSGKPKDEDESADEYLKPFVTEVLEILESGGIVYENEIYDLNFRAFVMDAPARAFIMNTFSHTGKHSCTKCIIEGIRIANRTVFHGVNYMPRSNFTFRNRIHSNHHHSDDATMIGSLPIDCVKTVPIDPMHNVYIGVTKQLFKLWINDRKKPYSISAKNIRLLSQRITNIAGQLPSEFSKKPRPLKNLKRFKATEFRQFALYTLIIVLEDLLPSKYYKHFLKFHCAIRILSTPDDCIRNNTVASELLTDFVKEFGILYGYHNSSFNNHSLLHLSEDVKHFNGPLDSYSAFKFENFLQYLKKLSRNNYRVLEQIRNRFCEKFMVHDYQGDFKKYTKKNKTDKFGNFTDIYIDNTHLSVKAPNNYVLINDGCITKINKITKNEDGSFNIVVTRVKDILPFYDKPIPSSLLNIFVSQTDTTSKNFTFPVTKDLRKVAKIQSNGKYFYLALLH